MDRKVKKLVAKAFQDRLDRQDPKQPEGKRKAAAAAELDTLLGGEFWRKCLEGKPGEEYLDDEALARRASPDELKKERADQALTSKLASLFNAAPIVHPEATPDPTVADEQDEEQAKSIVAKIKILLGTK